MACSKYEYVKDYEENVCITRDCFSIIRLDGQSFSQFTSQANYTKPVDERGLTVMVLASDEVMKQFADIICCYVNSDEVSFLLSSKTSMYGRRKEKILSLIVSLFTGAFVQNWPSAFCDPQVPLPTLPKFDGRVVVYPKVSTVIDYFLWRQVDCHINNLYNHAFYSLTEQNKMTEKQAHERLKSTLAAEKNEILHAGGINYNNLPQHMRKGTFLYRPLEVTKNKKATVEFKEKLTGIVSDKGYVDLRSGIAICHSDLFDKLSPLRSAVDHLE